MKTIIIGGVAGGASTAARLRRLDEQAEIIMLERGAYISYANCGLPYYIGGVIEDREQLLVQTVEGFKSRFNVDVRVLSEATAINPEAKTIRIRSLSDGREYDESYDKLVISTGAEPIKPPIPGIDDPRIMSLRTVPDTDRIKQFLTAKNPKKAVVIGGGFIGLEMVENLHEAGIEVCIVERLNQVMAPLDFPMATHVHAELRSKGVGLLLEENVVRFESSNEGVQVQTESGKKIDADLVILSIGVRPETKLAKEAGIAIGKTGGIQTNEYMQTSNEDIYALGDAAEVYNPVIKNYQLIPLAGPANKQGRIIANNIAGGNKSVYKGSIGTSIAKVFDLTVAATGASTKLLDREGIEHLTSYTHSGSNASYYPGSMPMSIKINFSASDGRLLGAQVVGCEGVDKRIDLFAQVIRTGGTIYDLQEIEHAYAPPYSSAKDPVNMAGFMAENILDGKVKVVYADEVNSLGDESVLIDIRTAEEFEIGHIKNSINLPLDELRDNLDRVPKGKKLVVYCVIGQRGYVAARLLMQHGFSEVYNLSGGYKNYLVADKTQSTSYAFPGKENSDDDNIKCSSITDEPITKEIVSINACGLQCPGPIMQLKKHYEKLEKGERLEIKVTDMAFGEDLKGWSRMTGASLLNIQKDAGVLTALLEKPKEVKADVPQLQKKADNKTLIVFSDDLDRALASFVIANGAAAAGKKVSIFFTFWGLNVIKKQDKPKVKKDFMGRMFGMMLPSSSKKLGLSQMNMGGMGSKMMRHLMKKKNVESLESLIQQAKKNGVEFIACSMSMDVMGIKQEELMDGITIAGVAAYLDRAEDANVNLFI